MDLNDALSRLGEVNPRAADVVKLRVLTIEEVAAHEQIAPSTVRRSWVYARAWLGRELEKAADRNC